MKFGETAAPVIMEVDGGLELPGDSIPSILKTIPVSPEECAIQWPLIPTMKKFGFLNHIVPEELKRILDSDLKEVPHMTIKETMALECVRTLVDQGMTRTNYKNYLAVGFFALYYAEELKVAGWRIESTTLYPYKGNEKDHLLIVPGVMDGSPEVRKGDRLEITYDGLVYEMRVISVVEENIYLKFTVSGSMCNHCNEYFSIIC